MALTARKGHERLNTDSAVASAGLNDREVACITPPLDRRFTNPQHFRRLFWGQKCIGARFERFFAQFFQVNAVGHNSPKYGFF